MNEITIEDVFYKRSEAEQKLHSLGLRKNKQVMKRLKSVPFCYWIMEGFDIAKIWEIEKDLIMERWILEDLIKENKS